MKQREHRGVLHFRKLLNHGICCDNCHTDDGRDGDVHINSGKGKAMKQLPLRLHHVVTVNFTRMSTHQKKLHFP